MVTKGQCKDCVFSRKLRQLGAVNLACCFGPPVNHLVPAAQGAQLAAIWPAVEADNWCGKFEADPMVRK